MIIVLLLCSLTAWMFLQVEVFMGQTLFRLIGLMVQKHYL